MRIQAHVLLAVAVLLSVVASGGITPSAADTIADRSTDAIDAGLVDPSVQRAFDETGSTPDSIDSTTSPDSIDSTTSPESSEDESVAATDIADPWAEAFAESSKLGSQLVMVDLPTYPVVLNPQVEHFINRFTGERRDVVGLWLSRANRYLAMIRLVFRNRGLPEDLAFTAMIESGFNPAAVSRMRAVGLWQFMATTARRYGLRVDQWVDERLDPEKSTVAAAAYFRDLYAQFGSWTLAQAAYNAGEVKVARAIRATGSNDFWKLARTRWLMRETKEFVPAIQAATVIGRDPVQYGFEFPDNTPVEVEIVMVPARTDLRRLASSGVRVETLRELNPTLIRGITPPGEPYSLRVPSGAATGVLAAIEASRLPIARAPVAMGRAAGRSDVHVVRPRDTVSSIAQRYGVSVGDVLRWNSLDRQDPIRPGDRLKVADRRLSPERQTSAR